MGFARIATVIFLACRQQDKKGQPQAEAGKVQVGHQKEFIHGNSAQALEGAVQGGGETAPSLELFKEQLNVALSALVWLTKLGWVIGCTQ